MGTVSASGFRLRYADSEPMSLANSKSEILMHLGVAFASFSNEEKEKKSEKSLVEENLEKILKKLCASKYFRMLF